MKGTVGKRLTWNQGIRTGFFTATVLQWRDALVWRFFIRAIYLRDNQSWLESWSAWQCTGDAALNLPCLLCLDFSYIVIRWRLTREAQILPAA